MKGFILDYINENEFKKLERALKKLWISFFVFSIPFSSTPLKKSFADFRISFSNAQLIAVG